MLGRLCLYCPGRSCQDEADKPALDRPVVSLAAVVVADCRNTYHKP